MLGELGILNFEIRQGEALHRQITKHIRSLIYAGSLASGTKLPRMHDLASQWKTNYFTVHTALTELVREGLLERKPRLGTFVRKQNKELRTIGIYYGDEIITRQDHHVLYRSLHAHIMSLLEKEKIASRIFIDSRPALLQQEPLPELADAVSGSAIQGLIVALIHPSIGNWIGNLSIPTSLFSPTRTELHHIGLDHRQMLLLACQALQNRGCKTVGLIDPMPVTEAAREAGIGESFLEAFHASLKTLNLKTKPAWIRIPRKAQAIDQEKFGYSEFHQLWSQADRPDGLIVHPENAARGAVLALLELRVQVPAELKLVLHRNQGVEFLCPLPADWVITREKDIARALLQQIKDRFAGIEPRSPNLPPTFEKGNAALTPAA